MKRITLILLLIIMAVSCKKPYNPKPVKNAPKILVVEGVINSSSDYTIIRLSRTVGLTSDSAGVNNVTGATVTVEDDNNGTYPLYENAAGVYSYPGLNLDITRKYRLRIKTSDVVDEYVSDFVPVKVTPPIDSIGFTIKNNGIQIYSNAHDNNNSTRYYRWDYEETWQFHSQYYSAYYSDGRSLQPRPISMQIYDCFHGQLSSDIVLGSSAKLQKDVIYQNPVIFIGSTSEKIETKYSILLNQYALTGDAFTFWTNLKKNTEQLGSIFDVQPSNILGNIHSVINPTEPVLGYVSACTVTSKRIFISNSQLPASWQPDDPYQCVQDTFLLVDRSGQDATKSLINLPPAELTTSAILKNGLTIGYLGADAQCVDCTLRGFTTPPYFWK
jgi:hypothetical protein